MGKVLCRSGRGKIWARRELCLFVVLQEVVGVCCRCFHCRRCCCYRFGCCFRYCSDCWYCCLRMKSPAHGCCCRCCCWRSETKTTMKKRTMWRKRWSRCGSVVESSKNDEFQIRRPAHPTERTMYDEQQTKTDRMHCCLQECFESSGTTLTCCELVTDGGTRHGCYCCCGDGGCCCYWRCIPCEKPPVLWARRESIPKWQQMQTGMQKNPVGEVLVVKGGWTLRSNAAAAVAGEEYEDAAAGNGGGAGCDDDGYSGGCGCGSDGLSRE